MQELVVGQGGTGYQLGCRSPGIAKDVGYIEFSDPSNTFHRLHGKRRISGRQHLRNKLRRGRLATLYNDSKELPHSLIPTRNPSLGVHNLVELHHSRGKERLTTVQVVEPHPSELISVLRLQ